MSFHQFIHQSIELFATHVLLAWLSTLVLVVTSGFWLSSQSDRTTPSLSSCGGRDRTTILSARRGLPDSISSIVFLAFLAFYIALILYKEDFAYYDDDMLTDFSLRGKNFLPPVWSALGRFYPLGDQEFNLFKFITRSPAGYHSLVVVQLVILLAVLFVVLRAFQVRYRVLVLIAAMTAPSFLIPFTGFVYPERNVLFWLVVMLLCLQGYSKTRSRIHFIGCLVAIHFALYYKETVVLLVVAYAGTQLLLQFYSIRRSGGQRSWLEFARENALSLGMLGVAAIYLVLFAAAILPHRSFSYINGLREPLTAVLLAYIQIDWLPLILLSVLLVRFGIFMFSSGQLDPLWEPLAVGALAYFFGVLSLRINSGYYMAPVDLIALLYLANMSLVWLSRPTKVRISVVAIAFICVFLHDAAYSSFRMVERKSVIATKSQFAGFLKSYLQTAKSDSVELFFPYADGYHLMGLASYLRYKGFLLEGQSVFGEGAGPRLVIAGRKKFYDNHCVNYRDYACIHAEGPSVGALIVVLPDDDVSTNEVRGLGRDSDLVFSVKACAVCTKPDSWFRSLHGISVEYSVRQLPEHWLQLDVYQRRL